MLADMLKMVVNLMMCAADMGTKHEEKVGRKKVM